MRPDFSRYNGQGNLGSNTRRGIGKLRPALILVVSALLVAGCGAGAGSSTNGRGEGTAADSGSASTASGAGDAAEPLLGGGEPVARVAKRVRPSVVQVNVEGAQQTPFGRQQSEGLGSGIVYREDGYIVTNDHVVADASQVNVTFSDGSTEQARVVGKDNFTDLAVLKVPRNDLPAARFVEEEPMAGQLAAAIGSPQGLESTVTSGVVSGLGREIPAELTGGRQEQALVDLTQTDAAISPGSSGGALADRDGRVIGVNVAYLPPTQTGAESIGFAIPASTVTSVADQLIRTGEAQAPYLGISTATLSPEVASQFDVQAESGALVGEVTGGSPADQAGLSQGDVITEIGGTPVEGSGNLLGALRDYQPGDRARLTVVSGGEERTVGITLGERPESASSPGQNG